MRDRARGAAMLSTLLVVDVGIEPWVLLPLAVLVATIATSTGVAGSNLWIPIYAIGLALPPALAFWASLMTMVFGSGSGLVAHLRNRTIDPTLVRRLIPWVLIAATITSVVASHLDARWLLLVFAVFAGGNGIWLLMHSPVRDPPSAAHLRAFAVAGGACHGALATGCGVWLLRPLLRAAGEKRHAHAVGSTVLLVFATSVVAAALRLDASMQAALAATGQRLTNLMVFAVPGVVVGGQLGPRLAKRLSAGSLRRYAAGVLLTVAVAVGWRAIRLLSTSS